MDPEPDWVNIDQVGVDFVDGIGSRMVDSSWPLVEGEVSGSSLYNFLWYLQLSTVAIN